MHFCLKLCKYNILAINDQKFAGERPKYFSVEFAIVCDKKLRFVPQETLKSEMNETVEKVYPAMSYNLFFSSSEIVRAVDVFISKRSVLSS